MKALLRELMAYNIWANRQITSVILAMDPGSWHQPVASSFPTLYKTLLHIWDADAIWWQRLEKRPTLHIPSTWFTGDLPELVDHLLKQEQQWLDLFQPEGDLDPAGDFTYTNLKGDQFGQPLYQVITHIGNHGTYHRGQLVTMLRALGAGPIPQTDFVHWARKAGTEAG